MATFGLSAAQLERAENLQWVQALSAGVDSYDREAFAEHDVVLTNASGVHAEPIGEQVLGYMLTFARRLHVGQRRKQEGTWFRYHGEELRGKTVGIVGVGAIGSRVAELTDAVGMRVVGTKRDPSSLSEDTAAVVDEIYAPEGLPKVLQQADYLVVACPLTEETRGLIGAAELRMLGREAVLVNVARGAVVDQDALTQSLRGDALRGAALDVFEAEPLPADSPLWDLPNVLITPHQAGSTPQWPQRCAAILGDNYEALRSGDRAEMRNRVV